MTRVQKYKFKRELERILGKETKLYVFSIEPKKINKIVEVTLDDITEFKIDDNGSYIFKQTKVFPYDMVLSNMDDIQMESGYGTGVGDLWAWTYYASFNPEKIYTLHDDFKRLYFKKIKILTLKA